MVSSKKIVLDNKLLIGRNEWCQLPGLKIPAIKAKIDTGAKTSAIHAFNINAVSKNNKTQVHFDINPVQGNDKIILHCSAPVVDERYIMSSNGHKEHRYVIATSLKMGSQIWSIELTLSNRDPLRYRMLLGREALNNRVLVHPGLTCNQEKITEKALLRIYAMK